MISEYQPITSTELEDMDLPLHSVGLLLSSWWTHAVGYMNYVIRAGYERYDELSTFTDSTLVESVGGYGEWPADAEAARKIFVELVLRLADVPLDSQDLVQAHLLVNGIAWARSTICSYTDQEERGITIEKLLDTENH